MRKAGGDHDAFESARVAHPACGIARRTVSPAYLNVSLAVTVVNNFNSYFAKPQDTIHQVVAPVTWDAVVSLWLVVEKNWVSQLCSDCLEETRASFGLDERGKWLAEFSVGSSILLARFDQFRLAPAIVSPCCSMLESTINVSIDTAFARRLLPLAFQRAPFSGILSKFWSVSYHFGQNQSHI